jgi:hypothetical protein
MYNHEYEVQESALCGECKMTDHGLVPLDTFDSPLIDDPGFSCCVTGYGDNKTEALRDCAHRLLTYGWDVVDHDAYIEAYQQLKAQESTVLISPDPQRFVFAITLKVR